jgi:hypothetical protein
MMPQILIKVKRCVVTNKVFYNVLERDDSISRSRYTTIKQVNDTIRVYQFVIDFMKKNISNYTYVIQNGYLGLLLSICKSALFIREVDFISQLPTIIREFRINYQVLRKYEIFNDKRILEKVQLWLLFHFEYLYLFLVRSKILTKLGLYK